MAISESSFVREGYCTDDLKILASWSVTLQYNFYYMALHLKKVFNILFYWKIHSKVEHCLTMIFFSPEKSEDFIILNIQNEQCYTTWLTLKIQTLPLTLGLKITAF